MILQSCIREIRNLITTQVGGISHILVPTVCAVRPPEGNEPAADPVPAASALLPMAAGQGHQTPQEPDACLYLSPFIWDTVLTTGQKAQSSSGPPVPSARAPAWGGRAQ